MTTMVTCSSFNPSTKRVRMCRPRRLSPITPTTKSFVPGTPRVSHDSIPPSGPGITWGRQDLSRTRTTTLCCSSCCCCGLTSSRVGTSRVCTPSRTCSSTHWPSPSTSSTTQGPTRPGEGTGRPVPPGPALRPVDHEPGLTWS